LLHQFYRRPVGNFFDHGIPFCLLFSTEIWSEKNLLKAEYLDPLFPRFFDKWNMFFDHRLFYDFNRLFRRFRYGTLDQSPLYYARHADSFFIRAILQWLLLKWLSEIVITILLIVKDLRGNSHRLFLKLLLITLCCNLVINRVFNQGEYLQ